MKKCSVLLFLCFLGCSKKQIDFTGLNIETESLRTVVNKARAFINDDLARLSASLHAKQLDFPTEESVQLFLSINNQSVRSLDGDNISFQAYSSNDLKTTINFYNLAKENLSAVAKGRIKSVSQYISNSINPESATKFLEETIESFIKSYEINKDLVCF